MPQEKGEDRSAAQWRRKENWKGASPIRKKRLRSRVREVRASSSGRRGNWRPPPEGKKILAGKGDRLKKSQWRGQRS